MIFMKIDIEGLVVTGTSENKRFPDQIDLESVSWDATAKHPGLSTTSNARTEVRPKAVKIEKVWDRSSSSLATAMLNKAKVKTATITMLNMEMVDSSGDSPNLMVVELKDGFVDSIDLSAGKSGKAMEVKETVTLSFRRFKLQYHPASMKTGRDAAIDFLFETKSTTA
jgi:type VI secretion system Hcp family effector